MTVEADGDGVGGHLLTAALDYAARGWPVFPCRPDKRPWTEHGFKDATSEAAVIHDLWRDHPGGNVGIATGEAELVVIDVDVKKGAPGEASWNRLRAELGEELEETACARTPSGGRHYYYAGGDAMVASSAGALAPGVDVRAHGGYVVAPPSVGESGAAYAWVEGWGPDALSGLSPALSARLQQARPRARASTDIIPRGERNKTLASIGGRLRREGYSEAQVAAALLADNAARCQPSLDEDEVRRIAASVSRYPAPRTGGFVPGSDLDNAERFLTMFGGRVRYCALERCWYLYDGRRWARDERLAVEDLMREALLSPFLEAAAARDDGEAIAVARVGARLQSAHARRAALECARSDRRISVHPSEFDGEPLLLNCRNGTLDLASGELRAHDPADLIRHLAPVDFDAEAHLDLWERFLSDATGEDAELEGYLQRAAGYSLTGETGERVFFLLLGPTSTGKSTFVEALLATVGDYGHCSGIEAFLRRTSVGGPRPEIASLAGRRLVTGVEVDDERRLDEVLIKQIVGGDTVSARNLYAGAVPFVPQCKLWFAANEAPRMRATATTPSGCAYACSPSPVRCLGCAWTRRSRRRCAIRLARARRFWPGCCAATTTGAGTASVRRPRSSG